MVILFISHMRLLRDAMVTMLATHNGFKAVGASSHASIKSAVAKFKPTLVIIDASHPEAITLVAAVRAHVPSASLVVLTLHDRDEDFLDWTEVGISGYLGPDSSAGDLVSTVRRAAAGDVVFSPRLTALLLNRLAERSRSRALRAGVHALTSREQEVAALLADGLPNKLIARQLCVALPTVKNHIHNILAKWNVRTRGEAAARYRRTTLARHEPSGRTPAGTQTGTVNLAAGWLASCD